MTNPGAPGISGPPLEDAAWRRPIRDLNFSTALTLVVVPTLFVLFAEKLGMKVA